jgi:hypothetical protein
LVAIVSIATKYGILQHILCVALGGKSSSETKTSNSFELDESFITRAIPISKVDASTSCIDLIDESCSPSCNENVVVETCDCLIAKKNDELRQEVKWL